MGKAERRRRRSTLTTSCDNMSCGRAGDAILDELGLNLHSSKRGRPKKSSDGQAGHSAAATDPGADTLTGIEFLRSVRQRGPDIDAQLAKIVSGFLTTRLPDDKLKEKLTSCLAPNNCASIVSTRVNAEIWDKLSTQTKSRDVKSQRTQNALVGAIA